MDYIKLKCIHCDKEFDLYQRERVIICGECKTQIEFSCGNCKNYRQECWPEVGTHGSGCVNFILNK